MIEVLSDLVSKASNHVEHPILITALMQCINSLILHQGCFLEPASSRNTARASCRESACLELDKTLRASVPKVSAVGISPTSALPCLVWASILPLGKAVSRNCFSSCFDSGGSGSGFL